MALINCTECNREISDKATTCPGCGAPVSAAESQASPPLTRTIDHGSAQGRKREKTGEGIAKILALCAIGVGFAVGSASGTAAGVIVMLLLFALIFAMYWSF